MAGSSLEPRSGWFSSARLKLHYTEWGDPSAQPLLLVHGGRDHGRSWDAVAKAFAPRWRVIAPDLRGHGDSAWEADGVYDMGDFVYDLAELCDALEITSAPVIGHSLGGNISLRYAALFPERVTRLLLIEGLGPSPALMAQHDAADVGEMLRKWIVDRQKIVKKSPRRYPSIEAAVARMKEGKDFLTDDRARSLTELGVNHHQDGSVSFKHDPALRVFPVVDITTAQKHSLWQRISCPVLMAYGKQSWASDPLEDGRAAHFSHGRVEIFDQAGHWLHHDREEAFIASALAFIDAT